MLIIRLHIKVRNCELTFKSKRTHLVNVTAFVGEILLFLSSPALN